MNSSKKDNYAVFEEEVKQHFHFLKKDYGFRLTQVKQVGLAKVMRFESSRVYVNLFYGPPAYEVEMSFGRIGIDDVPGAYSFEQGDIVLLDACTGWKWDSVYPDHLTGLIAELARLLRECGSACLRGDQTAFEEMKERRDAATENWRQEERAKDVRKEAESAWSRKDYGRVASLYESIKAILTNAEKKKLEYAKKYLQRTHEAE